MATDIGTDELELLHSIDGRAAAMLESVQLLSNINSGSFNKSGIRKVHEVLSALFHEISEQHEQITLDPMSLIEDDGSTSLFTPEPMQIFRARPNAALQILCTGHSDTVFPSDTHFNKTWIDKDKLRGPGTADMKGGLIVLLESLRGLHSSSFAEHFGFTVAISPDEEIGSICSAPVLTSLAKSADFGLTYEPALADGTMAGSRKGSGNFVITAKGLSSHAGRDFFAGRNAVVAIARAAALLSDLSDKETGVTVNIGKIIGGGPVNVVPDQAMCRFEVRFKSLEQQALIERQIHHIIDDTVTISRCDLQLHGGFYRPPKPITEQQNAMLTMLHRCGKKLDIPIRWQATGGCCEGNNLAAAGLPNIDTLGVCGANIHSDAEYAVIDSFVERAKLSALFVTELITANIKATRMQQC